jgi:hypothetical protein
MAMSKETFEKITNLGVVVTCIAVIMSVISESPFLLPVSICLMMISVCRIIGHRHYNRIEQNKPQNYS